MKRSQLIMEMELYLLDRAQDLKDHGEDKVDHGMPQCPGCGVAMMIRNNRITKEPYLGCRLFPTCRHTLPMSAIPHEPAEEIPVPTTPVAKRTAKKRGGEPNSDGSWKLMEQDSLTEGKTINANVSQEEMALIEAHRAKSSTAA